MPSSRYERIAAYSTLLNLNRVLTDIFLIGHWLTEWEPRTGSSLLVPDIVSDTMVAPTGSQLKGFCDQAIIGVAGLSVALNAAIANAGFRSYLTSGLADWLCNISVVDNDAGRIVSIRNNYAQSISEDKQQMSILGYAIQGVDFDLDFEPAPLSDGERMVVIAHDLLDAIMFNLRRLNDANGEEWVDDSIDNVKRHLSQRFISLNNIRGKAYALGDGPSLNEIYGIADYVNGEYQGIKNKSQANNLADYIETNIPRLPLFRRYWNF